MSETEERWCPDVCPITFRPFFMWVDHPRLGMVPTYGGPFDSYTIPEPELPITGSTQRHEVGFLCERFDHDLGGWVEDFEDPGYRVIDSSVLVELLPDEPENPQRT